MDSIYWLGIGLVVIALIVNFYTLRRNEKTRQMYLKLIHERNMDVIGTVESIEETDKGIVISGFIGESEPNVVAHVKFEDILDHPNFISGGSGHVIIDHLERVSSDYTRNLYYEHAIRDKAWDLGLEIMIRDEFDGVHFQWRPKALPANFS